MNSQLPSGPDGEEFSAADLEVIRKLVPAEPEPEKWALVERSITRQLHPESKLRVRFWGREKLPWVVLGIFFVSAAILFFFATRERPISETATNVSVVEIQQPSLMPRDSAEEYPIAQPGEIVVLQFEPQPGCVNPDLPAAGCPKCPVIYATTGR